MSFGIVVYCYFTAECEGISEAWNC